MADDDVMLTLVQRVNPELIHLKVAENTTGCQVTGDKTVAQVWGQHLTEKTKFVGCPKCVELMHS